jgi:PDDEXK-like domain of unknown function (DUF3799)
MAELTGFYEGMDFDGYAGVYALNGSSLIHMRRSPMKYRHERDNPTPPSPAMLLGVATHRMILEPDRINDFAVWGTLPEEKVRNGKVWERFKELNAGATIITVAERDAMVGMAVGARKNVPIMKYANAKGRCEVSMFWRDSVSGRRYKGRVDKIVEGHVIADLKTTRDCRSFQFGAQAFQLGYHVKMAMYWWGYKAIEGHEPKMRLLAIEPRKPHESAVYRVTKDVLIQGMEEWQQLEQRLTECERNDYWPAAEQEETDLILPAWTREKADEGLDEFAMEEEEA